jgi:hypothetical protein
MTSSGASDLPKRSHQGDAAGWHKSAAMFFAGLGCKSLYLSHGTASGNPKWLLPGRHLWLASIQKKLGDLTERWVDPPPQRLPVAMVIGTKVFQFFDALREMKRIISCRSTWLDRMLFDFGSSVGTALAVQAIPCGFTNNLQTYSS